MADNKKNIAQSPFFQFMGLLGDVVLLNLAWLIGCLPLVTIGASTCAAFSVAGKMAADESYSVFADYRAAFKRDWKQATLLWLAFAAVGAVIVADYQIGLANSGSLGGALIAAAAGFAVCWICAFGGSFAVLARYTYPKIFAAFKDGAALCVTNPFAALKWLGIVLAAPLLRLLVPALYYYLLPTWSLLGGGVAITVFSYALRPAFARLEGKGNDK